MKQHIASFDFFVETEIKNVVAAERDGVFKYSAHEHVAATCRARHCRLSVAAGSSPKAMHKSSEQRCSSL